MALFQSQDNRPKRKKNHQSAIECNPPKNGSLICWVLFLSSFRSYSADSLFSGEKKTTNKKRQLQRLQILLSVLERKDNNRPQLSTFRSVNFCSIDSSSCRLVTRMTKKTTSHSIYNTFTEITNKHSFGRPITLILLKYIHLEGPITLIMITSLCMVRFIWMSKE